jgi:hypothetical protein
MLTASTKADADGEREEGQADRLKDVDIPGDYQHNCME